MSAVANGEPPREPHPANRKPEAKFNGCESHGRGRDMRFNSYDFAVFFAALLPAYWLLERRRGAQNVLLLVAGYYFYACWNPKFLALLCLSTIVDFGCGLWIDRVA